MTENRYPNDEYKAPLSSAYGEDGYGAQSYGTDQPPYSETYGTTDGYREETYSEVPYEAEAYRDSYADETYGEQNRDSAGPDRTEHSESVREGDLINIIDRLEDTILNARSLPFSGNAVVPREEVLLLIGLLRDNLPTEIHRANWLLTQNRQVIEEARNMADSIVRQAERREATMINEHEITLRAGEMAAQTLDQAKLAANEIRNGAIDYASRRLSILEEQLTAMLVTIQKNKKELR